MQFTEAQLRLQQRVAELTQRRIAPHAAEIEGSSGFPHTAHKAFAKEKLFTLAMPRSYGGLAASATGLALVVETIARVSPSSALMVFATNAVARIIALTGTSSQKDRLFSILRQGDKCMAFCLTEPDHGSDVFNLTTRAERDGDEYVVNGSKTYVTLGSVSAYYLAFVRTGPGPKAGGISALVIPHDAPGLSFGPPEKKMGLLGSVTCQMYLDKARVPVDNRLWEEGEGWRVLTEISNPMRVWGAGALALGTAQGILDNTIEHARTTKEGGRSLLNQQAVAFALADMKMKVEACRSLLYRVCAMIDTGTHPPKEVESFVSMAKCYAADTGMEVADLASKVLGPAMARADNPVSRMFCVAKGIQIFDGSNQIQRLIVARNLAVS